MTAEPGVRLAGQTAARTSRPRPGGKRLGALARLAIAVVAAIALAGGAVLAFDIPLPGISLSVESVAETIRSWGAWGVVATIGLMVVHAFIPFPAECVALAAGMIYGPVWGTVIAWVGAMCGAWLSFGLAKLFGRPLVERLVHRRHRDRIDRWAESQGAQTLLAARLMPVIAFNLINHGAGLTAISWWTFTWTTAIGILPLTALMVVAGDQMHQLSWVDWLLLSTAAAALWGLVFAIRRRRRTPVARAADGRRAPKREKTSRPGPADLEFLDRNPHLGYSSRPTRRARLMAVARLSLYSKTDRPMFAVVRTGGKQYRVSENDVILVEKLTGEAGETIVLDDVLAVGDGGAQTIGTPTVAGASVAAQVIEQTRGQKIIVFKKNRRKKYRRKRGHRQQLTALRINEILTGGKKPSAAKKAAPKTTAKKDDGGETKAAPKKAETKKTEAKTSDAPKPAAKKPAAKAEAKKPAAKKPAAKAAGSDKPAAKKPAAKKAAAQKPSGKKPAAKKE